MKDIEFDMTPALANLLAAEDAAMIARWNSRDNGAGDIMEAVDSGKLRGILDCVKRYSESGQCFIDLPQPSPAIFRALKALGYQIQLTGENGQKQIRLHWGDLVTSGSIASAQELSALGFHTGLGAPVRQEA